ncbi:MAG: GNAT family N-acetyltransferase, partial [[Eubacterium] saphenum]|nr:GNAT family N-acetyltransferase [[Eubacterium] saphenum]
MKSEITVRIAKDSDLNSVLAIRMEMLSVVNEGKTFGDAFMERTRGYFTNGAQMTVLAFDGENAVGCATICYVDVMPTYSHPTGKRAHIMNVYVRDEYRRRGIAREMMKMLLDEAKARGVTQITLDATESGRPL